MMAKQGRVTFSIQVNGGPEQEITVATGVYISAAAAVPALLGLDDFPVRVRIWVPELQPDYPPLTFVIDGAGEAVSQDIAACARDWRERFATLYS